MKSGPLDRRITIQRATVTANSLGEGIQSWSTLATVWASVEYIKDAEREQSGQIRAERAARFVIRWSPTVANINAKDRLLFSASGGLDREWVELTDAEVSSVTFQNVGERAVYVKGTAGSDAPADFDGILEFPPGSQVVSNLLADLFPGIVGVNRLWAYANGLTTVSVSHAPDTNRAVTVSTSPAPAAETYEIWGTKEIGRREGIEISATMRADL